MTKRLKIIPLGGYGEIGKNCTLLEYGEDILVIDAGLMFPEDDMLGVDLVIPDWSYLVARRDKVRGIVLTHGHEDHVGGLPYLLKQVSAPLYATPLTRGLVEAKLRSHGLLSQADMNTIWPGQEIEFPSFRVTPFHVNHSIPDAVGLAIRTPLGLVVHTGDFKIDHTPLEAKTTDLSVLARLAHEGVMVLLSDSTNAESPGYTASERQLVDTFQRVFSRAEGRIIVATFASLISRIQLVAKTAAQFGRRVAIAGRSMEENIAIAEKLGYVDLPAHTRVSLNEMNDLPDREVCVLATGSQGEPNAVLARMASGRFRQISVRQGDTVVFSSKAIPGNETQIYRNIDNLFRQGAHVVYGEQAGLHVSGHAAQEELKLMLNLLRPLYFVPMHGAYRMLQQHAQLAYELGFAAQDVFVLDNGMPLELDHSGAHLGERMALETVFVDGSLVGDVGDSILRDRLALSQDGFVIARVSIEAQTGQVTEKPEIISQGFVYVPGSLALMQAAELAIMDTVEKVGRPAGDLEEMERHIKRRLESLFYGETKRRPVVIPMVDTL
jgi:ribonuclease J